ncbi:hypothetical protein [Halomonas sp. WWR20]
MTSGNQDSHNSAPRGTGRRRTQWWLASLLVSCLLPAGLVQAEAMRIAERLTQICLMAPEAIRAESRRVAERRVCPSFASRLPIPRIIALSPAPWHVPSADHDVLSRRGPPVVVKLRLS